MCVEEGGELGVRGLCCGEVVDGGWADGCVEEIVDSMTWVCDFAWNVLQGVGWMCVHAFSTCCNLQERETDGDGGERDGLYLAMLSALDIL